MAQREGRCTNYDLCGIAARHETVTADEHVFICTECGKPLTATTRRTARRVPLWAWLLAVGGLVAAAGYYAMLPPTVALNPLKNGNPQTAAAGTPGATGVSPPVANLIPIGCSPAPLLMPTKKTLHQRVLVRPEAYLAANPGGPDGKPLPPLLTYYVYQRRSIANENWLQVGAAADCRPEGWVREARTVPWKQQIVIAFDNPAGRDRVLLFKDAEDLRRLASLPKPGIELAPLLASLRGGSRDPRIVAAEPENYVDFTRNFYLLPILDFKETNSSAGMPLHLLKVHSVAEQHATTVAPPPAKAAVVFVIDSTVSMKPYIERTRQAVRDIFKQLSHLPDGNEIRFGVVAYRSDVRAVPGLEYVSRVFVDPNGSNNASDFESGIGRVQEARVSSARFDEDAYAGVMHALKEIDWSSYKGGRHLVLISDAGALDADDALSQTRKSASEVAAAARDRDVLLYAIHLKTPAGRERGDHPKAERQYRQLTGSGLTGGDLYYPAEQAGFGNIIDCAVRSMTHNIRSIGDTTDPTGRALVESCPKGDAQLNKMREDAQLIGLALRMKYLGLTPAGKPAPSDFEGWIPDRDISNPIRPNVEVRVLLTKNQLSNLSNGVRVILDAAKSGRTSADQFYRSLVDFASRMGRDPSQAKPAEHHTIADLGILGEYLDDLPYKSAIMALDQDTWENWSDSQQDEFIRSIENKLERYTHYESDCNLWTDLTRPAGQGSGGCSRTLSDTGATVYPVPLDALP